MTPNQLFTAGALRLRHSGLAAVDFFDSVPDDYGTEEDGVSPDNSEGVEIPSASIHLSDEQLQLLQDRVNPLAESDNFGVELYEQVLLVEKCLLDISWQPTMMCMICILSTSLAVTLPVCMGV